MAGERLASAARRVARAPSRLYCWGGRLDIALMGFLRLGWRRRAMRWETAHHADGGDGIFAFDGGVENGIGFVVLESPHGRGGAE